MAVQGRRAAAMHLSVVAWAREQECFCRPTFQDSLQLRHPCVRSPTCSKACSKRYHAGVILRGVDAHGRGLQLHRYTDVGCGMGGVTQDNPMPRQSAANVIAT